MSQSTPAQVFRAEAFLLGMTVIWGGTYIATKITLKETGPFFVVAIRFGLSAILFLHFARGLRRHTIHRGAILGVLALLAFALQTIGLQYTTTARSAFITGLFVFFTPLFDWLWKGRRVPTGVALALPVVLTGLYLLAAPEGRPPNLGDYLTLVSAVVFSLHIIALDDFTRQDDFRGLLFVQFASTGLFALVPSLWFEPFPRSLSLEAIASLLYLTLLATFALLYIQMRFQKETTPVRAAVIYSLEPVFASVFALLLLREQLGTREVVGGSLLVLGVLISELWGAFRQRRQLR